MTEETIHALETQVSRLESSMGGIRWMLGILIVIALSGIGASFTMLHSHSELGWHPRAAETVPAILISLKNVDQRLARIEGKLDQTRDEMYQASQNDKRRD